MHYIDGFVLPVPRASLQAYRDIAQAAGKVWMEYGALQYWECAGDDVPMGKLTSFPQAVQLKDDEIVFFSWIVYASRAERDRINAKVMKDARIAAMDPATMPFDARRMFWGGFESVVEFEAQGR